MCTLCFCEERLPLTSFVRSFSSWFSSYHCRCKSCPFSMTSCLDPQQGDPRMEIRYKSSDLPTICPHLHPRTCSTPQGLHIIPPMAPTVRPSGSDRTMSVDVLLEYTGLPQAHGLPGTCTTQVLDWYCRPSEIQLDGDGNVYASLFK